MDAHGEWKKWNQAGFYGAPFIWTTLHDFGGTNGMKGNLSLINQIPFDAVGKAEVWGTGYTPEGIDQNPVYYEFMAQNNFRKEPVKNIPEHIVKRSTKRYGLKEEIPELSEAWKLLVSSTYSEDHSVQDGTGIPHLPGWDTSQWSSGGVIPVPALCRTFFAWKKFVSIADLINPEIETFRYDLVNLGREVLAQLSTPISNNFSNAYSARQMSIPRLKEVGQLYIELLKDIDRLVGTDPAFMLGPWLTMAKRFGNGHNDCGEKSCPRFYEWNARAQLTTWNPTPKNATQIPSGPIDYASKHWSGLIRDYYAKRAELMLNQALRDATQGKPLNIVEVERIKAQLAFDWTNSNSIYPNHPTETDRKSVV